MFHPRNATDALIRAGGNKDAKVHLHLDEAIDEARVLKMLWKAEAFEEAAEDIKRNSKSEPDTTCEWLVKKAKRYREQADVLRENMADDTFFT